MAAIVSAGWAQESSFASVSASTGLPDVSGLTFKFLDADEITFEPETVMQERADASRRQTAEAPASVGEGGGVTVRRGTLTVREEVHMPGTDATAAFAVDENLFSAAAVDTLLNDEGAPAAQSDAVSAAGATIKQWTPTAIGNVANGDVVGFVLNGKARSARVTGRSGGDLLAGLALPSAPADTTVGRLCRQWYANTGWSTNTLAFQLDGIGGQRAIATGCKLETMEIAADEAGRVMATYTFRVAYYQIDNGNHDLDALDCTCSDNYINATAFDGGIRIASDYCGSGGTLATPANSDAVSSFDAGQWSLTFNAPLEANMGVNSNNIGMHGWRVGNPTVELTIPMCTTNTSFDSDRLNKAKRQVVVDCGVGTEGAGFSIWLNGAVLKSDPKVFERGDSEFTQKLVFQSGPYCNDTTTAPAANGVNAWFVMAWWL